jgi:hypothetical protein
VDDLERCGDQFISEESGLVSRKESAQACRMWLCRVDQEMLSIMTWQTCHMVVTEMKSSYNKRGKNCQLASRKESVQFAKPCLQTLHIICLHMYGSLLDALFTTMTTSCYIILEYLFPIQGNKKDMMIGIVLSWQLAVALPAFTSLCLEDARC